MESKKGSDISNASTPQFISPKNTQIINKQNKSENKQLQKGKQNSKVKTLEAETQENLNIDKSRQRLNRSIHQKEKSTHSINEKSTPHMNEKTPQLVSEKSAHLISSRQKISTVHTEFTNPSPTGSSTQRLSPKSRLTNSRGLTSSKQKVEKVTTVTLAQIQPLKKNLFAQEIDPEPPITDQLTFQDMSYVKYFEDSETKRSILQKEIMKCLDDLVSQKDTYSQIINDRQDQLVIVEREKKQLQNQIKSLQSERDVAKSSVLELKLECEKLRNLHHDYKVLQDQSKGFYDEQDKKDKLIKEQQKRLEQQMKDVQQVFDELQSYKKYESRKEKTESVTELAALRHLVDELQWRVAERDQEIDELKQKCRISTVLESNLELSGELNQILQNEARDYRKQIHLLQGLVEQYKEQLLGVSQKKYEVEWNLNNEISVKQREIDLTKDKLRDQDQSMRQYEIINQEIKCEIKFLQGKLLVQEDLQAQLMLRNEQNKRLIADNKELTQNVSSLNSILVSISENQLQNHNNGPTQRDHSQNEYVHAHGDYLDTFLATKLKNNKQYMKIKKLNPLIGFVRKEPGQYYFGKQKLLASKENDIIYLKTAVGFQTLDDFLDLQAIILEEEVKNNFD